MLLSQNEDISEKATVKAVETLTTYMRTLYDQVGLVWRPADDDAMRSIVDDIAIASVHGVIETYTSKRPKPSFGTKPPKPA